MALTAGEMTPTTLTAYITETWTPKTLEQFFAKAVAANHFLDLSAYTGGGSDIFHVPDVFTTAFTVTTAPDPYDAVEITTNGPATGDITLTVDTHKYIAMLIGDRDMVQIAKGTYDVGSIYARKAGGTLMEALEADLFALWSSVSTNTVGDTASVITDTEIRQSIEKLASLKVPLNETAWFFHPYSYWIQIVGIQKYYDASQFGAGAVGVNYTGNFGSGGFANASVGKLFGIQAFQSANVVNTLLAVRNLLAHKDAFAFATQLPGGGRIRFQAKDWLSVLGTLSVWDTHYGVVASRQAAAVRLSGSNAFITS